MGMCGSISFHCSSVTSLGYDSVRIRHVRHLKRPYGTDSKPGPSTVPDCHPNVSVKEPVLKILKPEELAASNLATTNPNVNPATRPATNPAAWVEADAFRFDCQAIVKSATNPYDLA